MIRAASASSDKNLLLRAADLSAAFLPLDLSDLRPERLS